MRMSVSVSVGVRVASKLLILSFLGGLGDWGRCWVLIPQGNAAQSSFVCMYNRGWMGNVCLVLKGPSQGTCLYHGSIEQVPFGLTATPGDDSWMRHGQETSAEIDTG